MIHLILFWSFFKIGLFTFGGGYAMFPLVEDEVIRHQWMSLNELVNFVAVSESTPGSIAVNISTYVGRMTGGFGGALAATFGNVLPSFLVILCVAKGYESFRNSRIMQGIMAGLKPAVIGMIGTAVVSVGKTVFFPKNLTLECLSSPAFWISLGIFIATAIAAFRRVHPILLIALSAVVGILAGYTLEL